MVMVVVMISSEEWDLTLCLEQPGDLAVQAFWWTFKLREETAPYS